MSATLYCDLSDIQAILSVEGVADRVDDDPEAVDDAIDDASASIEEYCFPAGYTASALSGNRWVTHRCAELAAGELCERRGNGVPAGIAEKAERAEEKLKRVLRGWTMIPGAAKNRTAAPVVSNYQPRLSPVVRAVVERQRSSSRNQPTDYPQRVDQFEGDWYSI